ncbi:hypothetical protein [Streptomyces sp. NPDC053048]|uniref:hypothetical protein n=1 Tax=Streptomyces sp. NPDC053048 TaxID=3365694 RepID=UPI0037D84B72
MSKTPKRIAGCPVIRAVPFASRLGEKPYLCLVIVDRGEEFSERGRFAVLEASSSNGVQWHGYSGHYDLTPERAGVVFNERLAELGTRVVTYGNPSPEEGGTSTSLLGQ